MSRLRLILTFLLVLALGVSGFSVALELPCPMGGPMQGMDVQANFSDQGCKDCDRQTPPEHRCCDEAACAATFSGSAVAITAAQALHSCVTGTDSFRTMDVQLCSRITSPQDPPPKAVL